MTINPASLFSPDVLMRTPPRTVGRIQPIAIAPLTPQQSQVTGSPYLFFKTNEINNFVPQVSTSYGDFQEQSAPDTDRNFVISAGEFSNYLMDVNGLANATTGIDSQEEYAAAAATFDVEFTAATYGDLAPLGDAGIVQHRKDYGNKENRQPNAYFDPAYYLSQNPDVKAAVDAGTITAFDHYRTYGRSEGRLASAAQTALPKLSDTFIPLVKLDILINNPPAPPPLL